MKKCSNKGGFSLLELLVVMAVIVVLTGITFKLWGMSMGSAAKANTFQVIQKVGHALEEFRSEYGQYPPTDMIYYEREDTNRQDVWLRDHYFYENPDLVEPNLGLVSYLTARIETEHNPDDNSWHPDTDRDTVFKGRVAIFTEGLFTEGSKPYTFTRSEGGGSTELGYTNTTQTILDGWGREIKYASRPPYQSYELWSLGQDGKPDTEDDIFHKGWDD